MVLPWHPKLRRPEREGRVHFHPFHYAPHPSLNIFGYAEALRADVNLRWKAFAAAPLALAAGWWKARQVARETKATIMHGHWVVPGGVIAAAARPALPLVVSLHGSDVYVAETFPPARLAARRTFDRAGFVTACSDDLARRAIALGADRGRIETVPYGVDVDRFRPAPQVRAMRRRELAVGGDVPLVFTAGRLVRKKGFEYLIDAMSRLPGVVLAIAGAGTLDAELRERARAAGVTERVRFLGDQPQDTVGEYLAAADVVCVPSVKDDSGNVDGLPNVVLEALASGTPLVTTGAGGIATVVEDGRTAHLVAERDSVGIANVVARVLADPEAARGMGTAARALVQARFGWDRAAERFDAAYSRALAFKSLPR
jgi:glycosyltransferase involved in cell wall biosynthesis